MKCIPVILSFLALVQINAQDIWKSDSAHSKVGFAITHLMISEVEGHFGDFEITAQADKDFDEPDFTVEIRAESIDTNNEGRDKHLRSPDFFEVGKFPAITFKTTTFEKTGDKTFKLIGDLTMHGVTKTISLEGRLNGIITQNNQKLKAGLKLIGTVNRLDFGVGGETPSLGDEVELSINLELVQQ
ncbi:YceI family protein [Flagellimonas sp.]|uniref:YceI family protein n=1 Tax=Flagellimonas sp. TaxID=2058762 RepID=UPI003BB1F911